ncbi:helix-turn-helix domain-containing protein [Azotobacter armeniacus]
MKVHDRFDDAEHRTQADDGARALAQEVWLQEQIVGSLPGQLQLPFALWSRPPLKVLIRQQFGVEVQDRLLGKYLKS